ncbi:MAG: hypothetical protein KAS88_04895 [Deltaproteobacteria bacterium]|nr:hypothetical protein [Deltaproteobacteria bacterium]
MKLRPIRAVAATLTLFLPFLLMVGCAATITRPTVKISRPSMTESTEALRVAAKITADKGIGAKAVITAKTPDLIRVEVYGAMRRLVVVVTGDEGRCEFFKDGAVKACGWEDGSIDSELGYLPNPKTLVPFLLNTKGTSPLSVEVGSGEGLTLRLSTNEYIDLDNGLSLPMNISIENPNGRLTIDYREMEINPITDESTFRLFKAN